MKSDKKLIKICVGIILFFLVKLFLPAGNGLTELGVWAFAIFITTLYLWLAVGVDWTSLLAIALMVMTGALTPTNAFSLSMGHYLVSLSIAFYILSNRLAEVGVTQHIAQWFITRNVVKGRPWIFIAMFALAIFTVTLFMSCITVSIVFVPMAEAIALDLGYTKQDKFYKALMFCILWITVITNGATPIGHTLPLTFISMLKTIGYDVSYGQFMAIGIPYALLCTIVTVLIIRFIMKPDISKYQNYNVEAKRAERTPLTKEGKIISIIFVAVIIGWLLPDAGSYFLPKAIAGWFKTMGPAIPPMIGVIAACIIKVDGKPVVVFGRDFSKLPWGTIIFIGAIMMFTSVVGMKEFGINTYIANGITPFAKTLSVTGVIIAAYLGTIIMTNFTSTNVTGVLFYTAFIPVLISMPNPNINIAVIAVMLQCVANIAVLTPPANPGAPFVLGPHLQVGESAKYNLAFIVLTTILGFAMIPIGGLFI